MRWLVRNLLALLLLPPGIAFAQGGLATDVRHGATLPATCQNQIFIKTGDGFYYCGSVANNWFALFQISNSLTTGTIPLASGPHALSDSPITYDPSVNVLLSTVVADVANIANNEFHSVSHDGAILSYWRSQATNGAGNGEFAVENQLSGSLEAEFAVSLEDGDGAATAEMDASSADATASASVRADATGTITSTATDGDGSSTMTQSGSGVALSTLGASLPVCTNGSKQFVTASCGIALSSDLASYVPTSRTVAGHALSSNVSIAYADLTSPPTLAANTTSTSHQFFNSYNSSTGAFGKAQPACADLSDAAATCNSAAESAITNLTTDLAAKVAATRSIATTSPITGGGDLSADRTIACASCVTASSPGAGIAHFAGSTQAVTSSAVVEADETLADNTTNNVSTSRHGYVPKAPNDATKYLDGTGAYSVPGALTWYQVSVGTSPATQGLSGANGMYYWGIIVTAPVTFSKITFYVQTVDTNAGSTSCADLTGSNQTSKQCYDLGIYSHAGTLLADIGPHQFQAGGLKTISNVQGSVTIAPGQYYFAFTGTANTGALAFSNSSGYITFANQAGGPSTSGGQLPSSITPAADSPAFGSQPWINLHQ